MNHIYQRFAILTVVFMTLPLASGTNWYIDTSSQGAAVVPSYFAATTATYQFSTGFSGVQGQNGWSYLYSPIGSTSTFNPMSYSSSTQMWSGNEQYLTIGSGSLHPGANSDAVLRWTAPSSGQIAISGTLNDGDSGGGDGIVLTIRKNSNTLTTRTISNGQTNVDISLITSVNAGDNINFVVNKGGTDYWDATGFDPMITYNSSIVVNGRCGAAAGTYSSSSTSFAGAFCDSGTANPSNPTFPAAGSFVQWTCVGNGTGATNATCTATRNPAGTGGGSIVGATIGSKEIVYTKAERDAKGLGGCWTDGVMGVLKDTSTRQYTFYVSNCNPVTSGIAKTGCTQTQTQYQNNDVCRIADTVYYNNVVIQNMKHTYDYYSGGPVYRVNSQTLLMVYHAEIWTAGYAQFRSLLGMAKSTNNGASWTDLGEIMNVQDQPEDSTMEVTGGTFTINGDYFYMYFRDRVNGRENNLAVARAKISDVVNAAVNQNTVVPWYKYYNGGWTEPALGGRSSELSSWPIGHMSITYNSAINKYILAYARTAVNNGGAYMIESANGINWANRTQIVTDSGETSYLTIVSPGDDASQTGQIFYVYYLNSVTVGAYRFNDGVIARRKVTLNNVISVVNGICGMTQNTCTAGVLSDIPDNSTHYLWQCVGSGGGITASCSLSKSVSNTHPADTDKNWELSTAEVSTYNLCWKTPTCTPSPATTYVSNANLMWKSRADGAYYYAGDSCPLCWVSGLA